MCPLSVVDRQGVGPSITRSRANLSRRKKCLLRPSDRSWDAEPAKIQIPVSAGVEAAPRAASAFLGLSASLGAPALDGYGIRPAPVS